jgi:hypothetical protein
MATSMTLFERFFEKMASLLPVGAGEIDPHAFDGLDLKRLSLENVRSMLGTTTFAARIYCETAVRKGVLKRGFQYLCPDGTTALAVLEGQPIPPKAQCIDEGDGDYRVYHMDTSSLERREYYSIP